MTGEDFAADQCMQGILRLDVKRLREFLGEVASNRAMDEGFGGGQQSPEARKPHALVGPQAQIIETNDFAERIIATPMGVAGEIVQRFEFAEDGDSSLGAEGLLEFQQRGDFVAAEQVAQRGRAESGGSHNGIVPTLLNAKSELYQNGTTAVQRGPREQTSMFTEGRQQPAPSNGLRLNPCL